MSYVGTVRNGVVILPPEAKLPEGAQVQVVPLEMSPADDPLLQAVAITAKRRQHWPKDYALNHGYYVSGEPKKS